MGLLTAAAPPQLSRSVEHLDRHRLFGSLAAHRAHMGVNGRMFGVEEWITECSTKT